MVAITCKEINSMYYTPTAARTYLSPKHRPWRNFHIMAKLEICSELHGYTLKVSIEMQKIEEFLYLAPL